MYFPVFQAFIPAVPVTAFCMGNIIYNSLLMVIQHKLIPHENNERTLNFPFHLYVDTIFLNMLYFHIPS